MLSNLFIDTDIILDIVLTRIEFYQNSLLIFKQFENDEVILFTSPSIIINAQYTGQRLIPKEKCRQTINYLLKYFIILEADMNILKKAYQSKFLDIEDAVQYYTATSYDKIDFFITRNMKDFKYGEDKLTILSPKQFVNWNI
jgi:predicted nucleic acid-binding protein